MKRKSLSVEYSSPEIVSFDLQCDGILCQSTESGQNGSNEGYTVDDGLYEIF